MSDPWNAKKYTEDAAFVPQLTSVVQQWLDPQSSDSILDIGCGDGKLTQDLSKRCESIFGIDNSSNMVELSQSRGLNAEVVDCSKLDQWNHSHKYSKVFSNATFHWILSQTKTDSQRVAVFKKIHHLLQPGGTFVCEMGGFGNVAEIQAAFIMAVEKFGNKTVEQAAAASPWYFPHEHVIAKFLQEAGFSVEKIERVYRSTELAEGEGLRKWLELFGFNFLSEIDESKRSAALDYIVDTLKTTNYEPHSKKWYAGYVRLRWVARAN
ncbi:S-adenosyl-L-methionine-dependent methyltransferase [Yarrowia lipolytica]|uniref:YALI0C14388p n=2 Tax=Yarrowia lipolytica TaxID=4952 RepID=Q6CBY7_YARLI|nr:YALI0C14388p [Yarrowia lipolytica CLIB122]AOW02866.1 hypothetical protein YALI1_C20078g [Yarrowia lipolytica]KAB8280588.1 S-adenosyl-L-methionine-dependent methyltransferase [Yarrowia lipolytica]KAE8169301.1 S-adenosyl-L-methionine-dependent methyltransferase [Yarrowia lipolytica]KAJ8053444.1 S-adenosyl-L-methionine-dependent methyltransferase [Yarrowia lipolytica]QNP96213.1 Putative methyltransferase [Yarrowia lipolytica]|eukprot:XP_501825.1 YALI0C14388p [Yarrowia lipolytica CLIB122]